MPFPSRIPSISGWSSARSFLVGAFGARKAGTRTISNQNPSAKAGQLHSASVFSFLPPSSVGALSV
uniref:Uncharacterized protein n=1 Tax=mine drainage metagenome TaxID=410659 RepID=E6Q4G3_9ZZZZ